MSNLGAELVELSVLVAGDDELSQRSPHSTGDLVIAARYRQVGLVVFCRERERGRDSRIIPLRNMIKTYITFLAEEYCSILLCRLETFNVCNRLFASTNI